MNKKAGQPAGVSKAGTYTIHRVSGIGPQKGFQMTETQKEALKIIASNLRKIDQPVYIPETEIFMPLEGGTVWTGQMTTHTLVLMLEGMVLLDEHDLPDEPVAHVV